MIVFGTRKTAWGHPTEGYGHYTGPTCPAHSPTAVLETQLSCCGYLKNLGGKNRRDSYFPRRPRRFSRLSDTAHTWLRCQPRESPSAGLRAGCIASHALSCAVRAAARVNTRGQLRVPVVSLQQTNSVLFSKLTKFDLRFEYKCSPNAAGSPQLQKGERLLFSANHQAPGRRDSFCAITVFQRACVLRGLNSP